MSTHERTTEATRCGGDPPAALELRVFGRVQGVGFRPFVVRLAREHGLSGWVRNTMEGVAIHVEGARDDLADFRDRVGREAPGAAEVHEVIAETSAPGSMHDFRILGGDAISPAEGSPAVIAPDRATCPRCLAEYSDLGDRRFGYTLLGCTECGPRFTMQVARPFDRDRTAMAAFPMCRECRDEYESPDDRRFHAQNIACPSCGPRIWLEEDGATTFDEGDRHVLKRAGELLHAGRVVGVKGVGGVHLLCDATNPEAVRLLRRRKHRERKPLAVIFADREQLEGYAEADKAEWDALASPAAPIVLVRRRQDSGLAEEVAPGLEGLGAMLAYTPVHRELVREAGRPLVATSANATDEPMPIEDDEARAGLTGIADAIVFHDREILRPADDSVVRVIGGRAVPLRVGRGLAPVRLPVPIDAPPLLATSGHLKAAIALARGREIVLGPHLGDLGTPSARRRFRRAVEDLCGLLGVRPERVACDRHPDYFTSRFAQESGLPVVAVQHHVAHVASCLAEHGEAGPALGIAWDGTGYGDDGTIWGGEFLSFDRGSYQRLGSLWPFPLVGGDRAAREPRRAAAGVCAEAGEPPPADRFAPAEWRLMEAALASPRGATTCTSAGRLFDAWACLLGLADRSAFEAEAALRVEQCADEAEKGEFAIRVVRDGASPWRLDWRPWVGETRRLLREGVSASVVAARLHNALARGCLEAARAAGIETVALSGGCFQNRLLSERVERLLVRDGFRVLTHRRVPPGDGGLAAGQAWVAALGG
jgi:hydrogenase maturation protein HypF